MNPKWSWISMVDRLSNGDITKHNDIYETNYIYCLNLLGFYWERDKYIDQMNKIEQTKQKNKR